MHNLRRYLIELDESAADFAARVQTSRQTIYRICKGGQTPKPDLARRIIEATGGVVSYHDLYRERPDGDASDIFQASNMADDAALDLGRVQIALSIVFNHLAPNNNTSPSGADLTRAAVAIANIFKALEPITTRPREVRFQQALSPIIAEILERCSASASAEEVERAAGLGSQLYFQTWHE